MTPSFLYLSAAIVLLAIGLLAPTLLRRQRVGAEDRRQYNVQVARDRLKELQAEHDRGELSDEEFEQARQDLDIALAQDLEVPSQDRTTEDSGRTGSITLAGLLLLIPLIVAATYLEVGTPDALGVSGRAVAQAQQAINGGEGMPPLSELVKRLEQQLEENPDNADGWFLLGRTYMNLSQYADAVRAYRRLDELQPDNSSVQIALADALSMQNGGQIPQQAVQLLGTVYQREPENVIALWLLGRASLQQDAPGLALEFWSKAYPLLDEEPDMQAELGSAIRELESETGLSANIPRAEPALPDIMAPEPMPAERDTQIPAGPGVTVEVALDPELMDSTSLNDTVFVYAKASAGPPMPLAVARKRVSDLPLRVTLSDEMAMMPQMKLSGFPRVKVGARISRTGQAIAQSGDLQSIEVETASDGGDTIQLVIDSRRP